jgi:cytochrome c oxidase assembly protein subunit 15
MSIFFVMLQAVLGGLTVKFRGVLAKKTALALHFGFSLICFASVVLLCIHLFQRRQGGVAEQGQPEGISGSLHWSVWGLTVFTYVVVYTGALVRHAKATMGCGYAFPTCGTTIFPNLSSLAGIHMLHRYAAAALWVLVLWFMVAVLRTCRERKDLVKGSVLSFALITLQALSGIATVESGGQLIVALIHTTIISVFFSILCYLCMQVGLPWKRTQWVRKDETVLT